MTDEERAARFLTSWVLGQEATPEEALRQRWEPEFLSVLAAEFSRVRDAERSAELWVNIYEHDGEYACSAYRTKEEALAEDSYNVMARAVRCVRGDADPGTGT